MSDQEPSRKGRFSYEGLERTLHERARLSIMTSLMSNPEGLLFNDLKTLCELSDGNLSRHLSVLEQADLLEHEKQEPSGSGRAVTLYSVTEKGRERYHEYMEELERLMSDAEQSTEDGKEDQSGPAFSPAT